MSERVAPTGAEDEPWAKELTPAESADHLRRILAAVEKDQRKRWAELTCAIVLSLATIASAWCAYQSTLWGGAQTFRLAATNKVSREANENTLAALQIRAFDAAMFIDYMRAKSEGNKKLEDFLFSRFRPEAKTAIDAWLKTDPLKNPNAPPHPFGMAEYVQAQQEEARLQEERAGELLATANEANQTSDTYVLLTVLFASVLFFGGISGTFDSRRLRYVLSAMALALFVATGVAVATMPICSE
jgi:hypothetical protein